MWERFIRWRAAGLLPILWSIFELPGYVENFCGWGEWLAMIEIKDNISWLLLVSGVVLFFMPEITKAWKRLVTGKTQFVGHAESMDLHIGLSSATGSTTPPSFWFQVKRCLKKVFKAAGEKRKAEERQKHLRRYWEADPKNGRKAARLMLVVDREDAEDIYREFAPWDDDPEMTRDSTKLYRWAVSFAWAYHLDLAGESDQVKNIMEEAGYSVGYWDKSAHCRDSQTDLQEFYVEPLKRARDRQVEENDK